MLPRPAFAIYLGQSMDWGQMIVHLSLKMETNKKEGTELGNLLEVLQKEQERWKTRGVTLEGIQTFVQAARLIYERAVILQHLAAAEARMKRGAQAQTETEEAAHSTAPANDTAQNSTPPVIHAVKVAPAPVTPVQTSDPSPDAVAQKTPPVEERKAPVFAFVPAQGGTPAPAPAPAGGGAKEGGPSLAQQLKQSGIPALGPAMGINDRVRYAGTFAGGNVAAFLALCSEIEEMQSLAEAREKLRAVAGPTVDWADEEGPAWAFLQLVQRLQKFQTV
jgi:hypothetical protein